MSSYPFDQAFETHLKAIDGAGIPLPPLFQMFLDTAPILFSVIDAQGSVIVASRQHTQIIGVQDELESITAYTKLFPSPLRDRVAQAFQAAVAAGEENTAESGLFEAAKPWNISVKQHSGSTFIYQMRAFTLIRSNGNPLYVFMGVDKTHEGLVEQALRDHKSQIAYVTFHDSLTGLPNRSLFYDRMEKSLSRAKRSNGNLAVLLIDLDRFKNINDSLGQEAGDHFLKTVANQLRKLLRETDTVARLSGDEFVVVLEDISNPENIETIANKILQELAKPVMLDGKDITCTASMGISLFPKDGDTTDRLLRQADLAMFRAKTAGKNRLQFYLKAMTDTAVNYLLLENDLRKAIENEDLVLHYQPQIDLGSARIIGLEALVRWKHPVKGMISPMEFIPLAEETGLIEPIGEWVLRHACERFNHWLSMGLDLGKIAVNLSARQFRQEEFEKVVENVLEETNLPAKYLELEITETSVMENAGKTVNVLRELNRMGLSLAIDDFGTGYSSLSYLKRFPIHKLKVDRSFIKDIDTNENDAAIAKSIIDLGHNMSLQVIAEGVERESQTRWLLEKGCDQVQGYFYSKPLSEDELMTLVKDEKRVCNDAYCIMLDV